MHLWHSQVYIWCGGTLDILIATNIHPHCPHYINSDNAMVNHVFPLFFSFFFIFLLFSPFPLIILISIFFQCNAHHLCCTLSSLFRAHCCFCCNAHYFLWCVLFSLLQACHLFCYKHIIFFAVGVLFFFVVVHIILFVVGAPFSLLHCASSSLLCVIYFFANCSKCNVFLSCMAHLLFCCMLSLVVCCKSIETTFYYRSSTYESF